MLPDHLLLFILFFFLRTQWILLCMQHTMLEQTEWRFIVIYRFVYIRFISIQHIIFHRDVHLRFRAVLNEMNGKTKTFQTKNAELFMSKQDCCLYLFVRPNEILKLV